MPKNKCIRNMNQTQGSCEQVAVQLIWICMLTCPNIHSLIATSLSDRHITVLFLELLRIVDDLCWRFLALDLNFFALWNAIEIYLEKMFGTVVQNYTWNKIMRGTSICVEQNYARNKKYVWNNSGQISFWISKDLCGIILAKYRYEIRAKGARLQKQ